MNDLRVFHCDRAGIFEDLSLYHVQVPNGIVYKAPYRGTSLERKRTPVGPYLTSMPTVQGQS